MRSLAIIIPAHNEEKRIRKKLDAYVPYFSNLVKTKKLEGVKILIVINASVDKTKDIVFNYKHQNLEFIEFIKGGKGFAVIEGFKHILKEDYTYIGFVDADMATTPEEFYKLLLKIRDYDGVIASRYISGAILKPRNTVLRIIASRIYNFFIRATLIIPYRDTQCGAKIFKRNALIKIINNIGMTSWAFDIEMLYLLNKAGYKIKEIPTVWSNEDYSTINFWRSGPWMGLAIIRLRILNSPFKRMVKIYDKFIRIFKPAK